MNQNLLDVGFQIIDSRKNIQFDFTPAECGIFSTLLALSGMAAIASANEEMPIVNMFYGTVAVGGEYVDSGTITAYINGEPSGSSDDIASGHYYISVEGGTSDDVITFEINGDTADQTAVWYASYQPRVLNHPPAVTHRAEAELQVDMYRPQQRQPERMRSQYHGRT